VPRINIFGFGRQPKELRVKVACHIQHTRSPSRFEIKSALVRDVGNRNTVSDQEVPEIARTSHSTG
jgi:hypothetical protein